MKDIDESVTWAAYRMWAVKEFERLDLNQKEHQKAIQTLKEQLVGVQVRSIMLSSIAGGVVGFLAERLIK